MRYALYCNYGAMTTTVHCILYNIFDTYSRWEIVSELIQNTWLVEKICVLGHMLRMLQSGYFWRWKHFAFSSESSKFEKKFTFKLNCSTVLAVTNRTWHSTCLVDIAIDVRNWTVALLFYSYSAFPSGNGAHVTCMWHNTFREHELREHNVEHTFCTCKVYLHVDMHVTWLLHACNINMHACTTE